jgi:hypothetical protein
VTNGSAANEGSYSFQFPADTYTRIAGEGGTNQYALYYTQSNTSGSLYGVDRTNNAQYPAISVFSSGEIYTVQPSGSGFNYIFIRGFDGATTHYELCSFDPTVGIGSLSCSNLSNGNSSSVSLRYETASAQILAVAGTVIKGGNADVPPASFSLTTLYSGFPASEARFIPGESSPGLVGVYDGSSTTTFLQWNGSTWTSYGSMSWPNAWIVPLH